VEWGGEDGEMGGGRLLGGQRGAGRGREKWWAAREKEGKEKGGKGGWCSEGGGGRGTKGRAGVEVTVKGGGGGGQGKIKSLAKLLGGRRGGRGLEH